MSLFLPVIILVSAYLIVQLLHWTRPGTHWDWIISIGSLAGVWLYLMAVPLQSFKAVVVASWIPGSGREISLGFSMTEVSWMVLILLTAYFSTCLIVSVVSAKLEQETIEWHNALLLLAGVYFVLVSADIVTIAIGLSLMDLTELSHDLYFHREAQQGNANAVTAYFWKLLSVMLMVGLILLNISGKNEALSLAISAKHAVFLLIAFIIRMFLWRNTHSDASCLTRANFHQKLIHPSAIAVSMAVLSRFSFSEVDTQAGTMLTIGLMSLVIIVMMFARKQLLSTGSFQLASWVFFCGVALCVVHGMNLTAGYWTASFLAYQAGLSLFSESHKRYSWIALFLLILPIGFPFNPFSPMWEVLNILGWVVGALLLGFMALLVFSSIKYVFQEERRIIQPTGGMRSVYIAALVMFGGSQWVLTLAAANTYKAQQKWWLGSICVLLGVGIFLIWKLNIRKAQDYSPANEDDQIHSVPGKKPIEKVIHYARNGLTRLFGLCNFGIDFLAKIQEDESWLLWSILFVALLISLVGSGVIK